MIDLYCRTNKGENKAIGILQFPNTFARMLPPKKIIDFYEENENSLDGGGIQRRNESCE